MSLFGRSQATVSQEAFSSLAAFECVDDPSTPKQADVHNKYAVTGNAGELQDGTIQDVGDKTEREHEKSLALPSYTASQESPAENKEGTSRRSSYLIKVCNEGDLNLTGGPHSPDSHVRDVQNMSLETFKRQTVRGESPTALLAKSTTKESADSRRASTMSSSGLGVHVPAFKHDPWLELSRVFKKRFAKPRKKEVLQIIQEFGRFRLDGNCEIGMEEFKELLHVLVKIPTMFEIPEKWVLRFWTELDVDKSGTADAQEIVNWYNKHFGKAHMDQTQESCADEFYRSIPGIHVKQFTMGDRKSVV